MNKQMAQPETKQPQITKAQTRSNRKYMYLALAVLVVLTGWSAFWYISYTKTQQLVDRLTAQVVDGEPVFVCNDQSLDGYPFRLFLRCSSYEVNHARSGWLVEGNELKAIWQVYAPNLAVIELEEQLTATHRWSGQVFDMKAKLIRGSVRFSPTDFVSRASFEATTPTFTSNEPRLANLFGSITADKLAFHARPTPDSASDLDLSVAATELAAGTMPIITGQLSFTARQGLSTAIRNQGNPAAAWLAQSGKIDQIDGWVEIGQKTLKLGGDVAFNQQGLANGLLKLKILNPNASNASLRGQLTGKRDGLNGPLTALQLMGKPVKDGDLVGSEVEIKLNDGQIWAGVLPVGNLPPLR